MKSLWLATLAVGLASTASPQDQPEKGIASWYGYPYHGRTAASGEVYNMETFVAAHPTLPFNTWVRVVNLENKRSVKVRIMDRGPFIEGRVIDLSHAAARAIGMVAPGTVPVRLELLRIPEVDAADRFAVQVGAFINRESAEELRAAMQGLYGVARVVLHEADPVMWRVWVGSEASEKEARALAQRIRERSGERHAFIVRADS